MVGDMTSVEGGSSPGLKPPTTFKVWGRPNHEPGAEKISFFTKIEGSLVLNQCPEDVKMLSVRYLQRLNSRMDAMGLCLEVGVFFVVFS